MVNIKENIKFGITFSKNASHINIKKSIGHIIETGMAYTKYLMKEMKKALNKNKLADMLVYKNN